jgi:hypothetical protein
VVQPATFYLPEKRGRRSRDRRVIFTFYLTDILLRTLAPSLRSGVPIRKPPTSLLGKERHLTKHHCGTFAGVSPGCDNERCGAWASQA